LAFLFALFSAVMPVGATTVRALDLQTQIGLSDLVIEGRVGGAVFGRNPHTGRPVSDTPVEIIEVLHGEGTPGQRISIRQLSGPIDGQRHSVVGDAKLAPGDHVILFLRRISDRWYLTALAQSVYWLSGEGQNAVATQRLDGLRLLHQGTTGWLPVAEDRAPLSAESLRRAIRSLAEEQP